MAFTDDLLGGLAQILADAGVGRWNPDGAAYTGEGPPPIVIGSVPGQPDQVITLAAYPVDDEVELNDSTIGVQARARGDRDPRTVDALDDDVFDKLHGLANLTLSTGVRVVQIYRTSGTPLGVDGNGRHERTSNYYVQAARPSAHRPD